MSDRDKKCSTDWDEYYSEPFPAAKLTRQISSQRIRELLATFAQLDQLKIAELGGGNSFIAGDIIGSLDVREYQGRLKPALSSSYLPVLVNILACEASVLTSYS